MLSVVNGVKLCPTFFFYLDTTLFVQCLAKKKKGKWERAKPLESVGPRNWKGKVCGVGEGG